jgi:GTPase
MTTVPFRRALSARWRTSTFDLATAPLCHFRALCASASNGAAWDREQGTVLLRPDGSPSPHVVSPPSQKRRVAPRRGDRAAGFVDHVRLDVCAGHGGPGNSSFTRGPNTELAPPDGGNGGHGGSIWLEADADVTSLRMWRRNVRAESGRPGASALRQGRSGQDLVIRVPPGTVARIAPEDQNADDDDEVHLQQEQPEKRATEHHHAVKQLILPDAQEDVFGGLTMEDEVSDHHSPHAPQGVLLCDLDLHGKRAQIARGGLGGRGNASFKSSRNRSPERSQPGTPGEHLVVDLELKTIADVGLVGYPNAGKSTLLRAISRATPKVASYPFTTLRPHIGVVIEPPRRDIDPRRITVADIPGLLEGAHENRGLGHEFLRHVERTSVLVYVLDMSAGPQGRKPLDILLRELELYEPGLSRRPACIAANKMDIGIQSYDALRSLIKDIEDTLPIFPISAKDNAGTADIAQFLVDTVHSSRVGVSERLTPDKASGTSNLISATQ